LTFHFYAKLFPFADRRISFAQTLPKYVEAETEVILRW